ncbi:CD3324 family protein [Paenibacillus taichungensis]|uniref:CD3324 family protein n=1 Tax=Paenibacillus taichungensis TaxID=484184 RepID=UPI002DB9FDE8|nr:CD3324 family protein [Paenibacillus taichungensis]MEC0109535.1 CD3324 family protein [Paenibacillus taichungensis]MEC0197427.1 CD3324 family protein [Paenibacillus taichungensis]
MKYINADTIFPESLLKEIQRHIPGGLVYIPKPKETHQKWGENSGSRMILKQRNDEIRQLFVAGMSIDQLIEKYCLSIDSIKKIVYSKK